MKTPSLPTLRYAVNDSPDNLHEALVYGIRIPRPSHPGLRRLRTRHAPSAQGHRTWNSTWLLIDYLQHQDPPHGLRILDLGCGWGLASVFCALHGALQVIAADADSQVFPFLHLHARLNQVQVQTLQASFAQIPDQLLLYQDLLIGADICFSENLTASLYNLLERALRCGVSRAILADPGRPAFNNLCALCAQNLGATLLDWSAQEPVISWSGEPLPIRGQLLLLGRSRA
jgi:predicted nicotinamide N-methyase